MKRCECGSEEDVIWLWPDEVWICDRCLKTKIRKVTIGIATR